ncbi:hypothetical protein RJ640_019396 [Escallonia rubra]|uniref:Myb-like domain-containing protein n=1 Tax=Escallonia rubra TaxID=112253 RepID=A0AA88U6D7_9ASTE|nr:hypothetical protein RJ640_019396 [Escallonia rubra]
MSGQVGWEWEENKAFEIAIALHLKTGSDEEWETIASMVPNKTIDEVKEHYKVLVEDIKAIEDGLVPIPDYPEDEASDTDTDSLANSSPTLNE